MQRHKHEEADTGMRANSTINISDRACRRSQPKAGFTLIELLVVIALTSILLTVVFKPLVASLDLTHRAATQTEAQAAARDTVAQVNQVLSLAEYVLDPTQGPINLWLQDINGNPYAVPSQFTMMEYIPSAHQLDQTPFSSLGGANVPIDPTTGLPSYQFLSNSGQTGLAFPLSNGIVLGRLFLGLVNNISGPGVGGTNGTPVNPYFNWYEWENTASSDPNKPPNAQANQNNTFTLYNAVVPTYILDPTVPQPATNYIPNLMLFHTAAVGGVKDTKNGAIIIEDPNFFYDNSLAGGNEPGAGSPATWAVPGWKDMNGDGKVEIWENWRALSSSLVRTDKVDLLALARDPQTNGIQYGPLVTGGAPPNNYPTVSPLVTFKPAFVQNDPAVATNLDQTGNEMPNPISPNFTSQYDHWASNYRVFIYRNLGNGKDPTQNSPLDYYEGVILPASYQGTPLPNPGAFKIVHITQAMGVTPGSAPPDPTNPALPDVSGTIVNGIFTNSPGFSFSVSADKGMVGFGYPSTSIIHTAASAVPPNAPLAQRYSPDDINNASPGPLGPGSRRFLSLTTLPTTTWGGIQLNPSTIPASPLLPGAPNTIASPSIVPGTELVFGPDQMPGIHYGYRIQYTRVSANAGFTGPNQYKINYTNNSNTPGGIGGAAPQLLAGYIEFNSQPDGVQFNSGTLTGGNFGQDSNGRPATGPNMLPIWKFNPNAGVPSVDGTLPSDPVEVYYNFQMNQAGDVVKSDYMTRALMILTLEMRLYDQGSGRAQITRLTDKIKVRNLQH